MSQLNLPQADLNIKKDEKGFHILDVFRNRFVKLTPEEWVRQNYLHFLINSKSYPKALIAVETELKVGSLKKRCDAIVYDQQANPILIIELKAPDVSITQNVFEQVAVYNSALDVDYFMISNGLAHYCYKLNRIEKKYHFFEEVLDYNELMEDIKSLAKE